MRNLYIASKCLLDIASNMSAWQETALDFFYVIWLPLSQLWVIIVRTASITFFINFWPKGHQESRKEALGLFLFN